MKSLLCAAALASTLATAPAHAQVGMAQLQFGALPVTLVYPSPAAPVAVRLGEFSLQVAPDGPVSPGVRRLVLLSHGTGGSAVPDHALAQALARAGFVVAQPLHQGDNYTDTSKAGPTSFGQRPQEALAVLDGLARHPAWGPRLNLDKVGVHGMSAGGTTALSLAGAQWRVLNLIQHCNRSGNDDEAFCYNGAKDGVARAKRQASFEAARYAPEMFLPAELKQWQGGRDLADDPRPDPRIAAVTLAVPVAAIYSAESLARVRVPVGVVSASLDQVLLPRHHAEHVLAHCKRCQRLADLPGGHFDVLWPWPETVARQVAATQVRGGATTPGFDARLRDAAQQQIVQFHLQHLGGAMP